MKRLSLQLAVLFVALLTANFECVARCASTPCQDADAQKHPCHGQPESPTSPCQDGFLAALEFSQSAKITPVLSGAWLGAVAASASAAALDFSSPLNSHVHSSPFNPQSPSYTVLRI